MKTTVIGSTSAQIAGLLAGSSYQAKLVAIDAGGLRTTSTALAAQTSAIASVRNPQQATVVVTTAPISTAATSLTFDSAQAPQVKAGEIIASSAGDGYLRRVTAVTQKDGKTVLATTAASVNEVYTQLDLNSTVKMRPVAASVATGQVSAQSLLPRGAAGRAQAAAALADTSVPSYVWAEAGFSMSGGSTETSTTIGRKRIMAVQLGSSAPLGNGTYGWATGATNVTAEAGDSGDIAVQVRTRTLDHEVCKVKFVEARPRSGGDLAEGLISLGDAQVKSTHPSGGASWKTQNFKLSAADKHVLEADYYIVKAVAYLDKTGDGCDGDDIFGRWEEKIPFTFNLAVTAKGAVLPTELAGRAEWTGDFNVRADIKQHFDPVVTMSARIESARLQSAEVSVAGNIGLTQTVTVTATGSGTLKPQIQELMAPRNFTKVYMVGAVPVVISGTLRMKARLEGKVTGEMNLSETFDYGFPNAKIALHYKNGQWTTEQNFASSYSLKLAGDAKASADLTLFIIPEFEIRVYEAASGHLALEPYLKAEAGVEGHFVHQIADGTISSDADYRFTALDVSAGAKAYAMAELSVWDTQLLAWPEDAKADKMDSWKSWTLIGDTKILGLPALSAATDFAAKPTGEMANYKRAALITSTARAVPNPLNLMDQAPLIPFGNWLHAYVVQPTRGARLEVEQGGTATNQKLWLRFQAPGSYTIRVPAQSELGLRQYIDHVVELTDRNGDGIVDQWAERYGLGGASEDPDGDGRSNAVEYAQETDPTKSDSAPPNAPRVVVTPSGGLYVGDTVSLTTANAPAEASGVMWRIGTFVASAMHASGAAFDYVLSASGLQTLWADFVKPDGQIVGSAQASIEVQANPVCAPPQLLQGHVCVTPITLKPDQTVTILSLLDDTVAPAVQLASGAQTTDTTPTLTGSLSAPLGLGQKVNVYDGTTLFDKEAVVDGRTWTFTPDTPLIGGAHSFTAEVAAFDGTPGGRSTAYLVNVLSTRVNSVAPGEAIRTVAGSFTIAGRDMPTDGLSITVPGDAKASCQAPSNLMASGFAVACTFDKLGMQTLEIRKGALLVGTVAVLVKTNVTGVSWTSPSTSASGSVKFGETVTFTVAGVNLLADPSMGFAVQLCGVSNTETGSPSNTARSFVCNFNNNAGAVAGQMPGVVKDAPDGQVLFEGWSVAVEVPVGVGTVPAPAWSLNFTQVDVTAVGGIAIGSPAYIIGKDNGAAVSFAGGSKLKIPNRTEMKGGSGITFDIWVKSSTSTWGTVIAKSHDARGVALMIGGAAAGLTQAHVATFDPTWRCTTSSNGAANVETIAPIAYGSWVRFTVVIDPNNGYRSYLNKKLVSWCNGIKPSMLVMDAQDSYLGGFSDYWWPLTGALQDLRIYNLPLTESQVQALP